MGIFKSKEERKIERDIEFRASHTAWRERRRIPDPIDGSGSGAAISDTLWEQEVPGSNPGAPIDGILGGVTQAARTPAPGMRSPRPAGMICSPGRLGGSVVIFLARLRRAREASLRCAHPSAGRSRSRGSPP